MRRRRREKSEKCLESGFAVFAVGDIVAAVAAVAAAASDDAVERHPRPYFDMAIHFRSRFAVSRGDNSWRNDGRL